MSHQNELADSGKDGRRGVRPAVRWVVAGIAFLFFALLHYGYFLSGGDFGGKANGKGEVVSCSPRWIYFGLLESCDIRTPGRNSPVVEADDRIAGNTITVPGPRIDGAGVGDSVLLTYSEGALAANSNDDPKDPSDDYEEGLSHWRLARPANLYGGAAPVQALLSGLGIFFCVRSVLAFRKRFDAPAPAPARIDGMDKFTIGIILFFAALSLLGAYLIGNLLMSVLENGSIGSVLSGLLMFVLGLVGVSALLGAALTWSSARDGDLSDTKKTP